MNDTAQRLRSIVGELLQGAEGSVVRREQDNMVTYVIILPQGPPGPQNDSTNSGPLRCLEKQRFGHGDLRKELEDVIRTEVHLMKGRKAASKKIRLICRILEKRGYVVSYESVRSKVRALGYYEERIP